MIKKALQIIIILVFICGNANSQETFEGEVLVQEITEALKSQSESLIINCAPNKDEFQKLLELSMKNIPSEDLPTIEIIQNSIISDTRRTFQATLESGQVNGVIWDEISLKEFKIEKEESEFKEIEKSDIYIYYGHGDTIFTIKLVDCIKIDGNWKLMDRIWWFGVEEGTLPNKK